MLYMAACFIKKILSRLVKSADVGDLFVVLRILPNGICQSNELEQIFSLYKRDSTAIQSRTVSCHFKGVYSSSHWSAESAASTTRLLLLAVKLQNNYKSAFYGGTLQRTTNLLVQFIETC